MGPALEHGRQKWSHKKSMFSQTGPEGFGPDLILNFIGLARWPTPINRTQPCPKTHQPEFVAHIVAMLRMLKSEKSYINACNDVRHELYLM